MGSYYECSLNILISVRPEDRERAEKCVVDAAIPVFAEMGYDYDHERLAKKLEQWDIGEGENRHICIGLYEDDLNYRPDWDQGDDVFQELADKIAVKLEELPLLEGSVSIPAYWSERAPDASGYVRLPQKKAEAAT